MLPFQNLAFMLSDHKWEIVVRSGSYYPALCHSFGRNDFGFACDDERGMLFFAYSYHIDDLDDPAEVGRRLFSLELLLNGALRIESQSANIFPTTFPEFAAADGGVTHIVDPSSFDEYPFNSDPAIDRDVVYIGNRLAAKLINLAKRDDAIRTLLFLFGMVRLNSPFEKMVSWGTLYRILDTVKYYAKEGKLACAKLDDKRVKEFTAAVNSMSILGLNARHGVSGNAPPKHVINDLNSACILMLEIATEFLEKYTKSKGY
jgi:hypothetical protein